MSSIAQLIAAPQATFNDGKVDRQGRFVIGSCETDMHDPKPIGGLYSLAGDFVMFKDILLGRLPW